MTYPARLTKAGLVLVLVLTSFVALALPSLVSAAHEPTHVVSEPTATPAMPELTQEAPSGLSKFFGNIGGGFKAVGRAIAGWFRSIGRILGLGNEGRPEGTSCEEPSDCSRGLACLNACDDPDTCEVFDKLCTLAGKAGLETIQIKPLYASCDVSNLCTEGTICTRTCPVGVDCEITNRCLGDAVSVGTCQEASDCNELCADLSYPPIGPSGFRASCRQNSCFCQTEEVLPTLRITACSGVALEDTLSCPQGLTSACTREGCTSESCPVRRTCLVAPAFGGQCLSDSACSDVNCAEGSAPFCDSADSKCRCKSLEAQTVSCSALSDCQGISCPSGQNRACLDGVCTCEKKTTVEEDFVCTADAQCPATCPETFSPACVDSACACQKVHENVPVSCTTLNECEGVSCPEEFEKVCLEGTCACTKTTTE